MRVKENPTAKEIRNGKENSIEKNVILQGDWKTVVEKQYCFL